MQKTLGWGWGTAVSPDGLAYTRAWALGAGKKGQGAFPPRCRELARPHTLPPPPGSPTPIPLGALWIARKEGFLCLMVSAGGKL